MRLLQKKNVLPESQGDQEQFDKDEFKRRLSLVLKSPQGVEISKRNWRVSDKFKGGQPIRPKPASARCLEAISEGEDSYSRPGRLLRTDTDSFLVTKREQKVEKNVERKSSKTSKRDLLKLQKQFEQYL